MSNILAFTPRTDRAPGASVNTINVEMMFFRPSLPEIREVLFGRSGDASFAKLLRQVVYVALAGVIDGLNRPEQVNPFRMPYPMALQRIADLFVLIDEYEEAQRVLRDGGAE